MPIASEFDDWAEIDYPTIGTNIIDMSATSQVLKIGLSVVDREAACAEAN